MSRNYVGIDVGTSLIKGELFQEDGTLLGSASFPSPYYQKDGIDYISAEDSFIAVKKILASLLEKVSGEVDAICFSSFGEAFALLGEDGKTKTDFILFVSSLGDEESNRLLKKIDGDEVASISGIYPNKMYSFSKLMHLKQNHPSYFEKGSKMLLVAQYMVYRLTGVFSADYSLASRTMLFDIKNKVWSKKLLEACDLPASLMPDLYQADQIVGTLTPELAKALGAKRECVVLASGHDQLLAALGSGLAQEGMANDGIGTAECLTACFSSIPEDPSFYRHGFCVVPYVLDGLYLTYAFTATGGALLKWHRDYLSPFEAKEGDYYEKMNQKNVKLPTSLFVLPYFGAAGTPHLDSGSLGSILGLTSKSSKEEIYFALMEGTSFEIRLNMDLLKEAGIPIRSISATGGGSKSQKWLGIKADIYHQPIEVFHNAEGGILGCFFMAKHAVEGIPYSALFAQFIDRRAAAKPSSLERKYEERYQTYKQIYPALRKLG